MIFSVIYLSFLLLSSTTDSQIMSFLCIFSMKSSRLIEYREPVLLKHFTDEVYRRSLMTSSYPSMNPRLTRPRGISVGESFLSLF